ncbi:MAG: NUDIX domain-containing protein [Duncaniella sp.]|nr:NUDIX domain-containing protein [Duncaniella sp.]MDE6066167.1 NUDIX domain-containing protein [Duncaniella sp.]
MAPLANNHISIDCVVLGFDGSNLRALLVRRQGEDQAGEYNDMKLPGSLIYQDEDLDEAAMRVLHELTGVRDVPLQQFKAFGSKDRTRNQRDIVWLERAQQAHVERIVTIAYFALVKLDSAMLRIVDRESATWVSVSEIGQLAFDHNLIIEEALKAVRREVDNNRSVLFDLLPKKFTASQLRLLTEIIYGRTLDVRNFHKKISQMPYVVPLEERQKGVAHRAARYFKFDRKVYNTSR